MNYQAPPWQQTLEGPALQALLQHLAACPLPFLASPLHAPTKPASSGAQPATKQLALGNTVVTLPRADEAGDTQVSAVVSDLLEDLGGSPLEFGESRRFFELDDESDRVAVERLRSILVACWLLHHTELLRFVQRSTRSQPPTGGATLPRVRAFLAKGLDELAALVPAERWVHDVDRREELVRHGLLALGLRPAGESVEIAADRLTTLNSCERARVVEQARLAEERARLVREELARKAAEEAAAQYQNY